MELIGQILKSMGADTLKSITWVPFGCCYLKSVKEVLVLTPQKIVLRAGKLKITLLGEGLFIGSFFEGDALIKGEVKSLEAE